MTDERDSLTRLLGVHHINSLVKDLDRAVSQYQSLLKVSDFEFDELPGRNVRTARFRAGETWIVLVQPIGPGEPQRVLDAQGEGLFLLSFAVADLDATMASGEAAGGQWVNGPPRQGLEDWRVVDVDPDSLSGGPIQLTEEMEQF